MFSVIDAARTKRLSLVSAVMTIPVGFVRQITVDRPRIAICGCVATFLLGFALSKICGCSIGFNDGCYICESSRIIHLGCYGIRSHLAEMARLFKMLLVVGDTLLWFSSC